MSDPIKLCEDNGFQRFMNGGGTHVYRRKFAKCELVVSGFDGDIPQDGWWLIMSYDDFDEYYSPSVFVEADDSAESNVAPRNFAESLAAAIETATTR
jgi:hypothetical protein